MVELAFIVAMSLAIMAAILGTLSGIISDSLSTIVNLKNGIMNATAGIASQLWKILMGG